jgi:hypothetical protein
MAEFPCLETSEFITFIADNSPLGIHREGYNGVASLIPRRSPNNLFVPTYAGMNYETINLTGLSPYVEKTGRKFEPRCEPMHVDSADDKSVVLVQPETSHAHVSARIIFSVDEPHYLHQRIELTAHRRFNPENEACSLSSLWASYMHMPVNRDIYMNTDAETELQGWYGLTKVDHASRDLNVVSLPDGEISASDHLDLSAATDTLSEGSPDLSRILDAGLPFYYGLCHDLVFLMLFKQPENFRLAYSPCGGGKEPAWNPAWDYVLRHEDIRIGKKHTWDLCLVVKPYLGRADVLNEVRQYQGA